MQYVSDFLQRLVDIITPWAEQLGAPGLALVAMLDSSFLSLPQVTDALIVAFTLKHPERWMELPVGPRGWRVHRHHGSARGEDVGPRFFASGRV